jgi:hypothetical protein
VIYCRDCQNSLLRDAYLLFIGPIAALPRPV